MWYAFESYNAETLYGWTQDGDVVSAVLANLNADREINLYSAHVLGDDSDEFDGHGNLTDRNDLICTDDSRPEDFE